MSQSRAAVAVEHIDNARRSLTAAICHLGFTEGCASVQQAHAVADMALHAAELAAGNVIHMRHLMVSVQQTTIRDPARAWAWCVSGTLSGATQTGYAPTYDAASQAVGAFVFAMTENLLAAE